MLWVIAMEGLKLPVEVLGVKAEGARSLVNENTVLERGSDDSMTLFVAFL